MRRGYVIFVITFHSLIHPFSIHPSMHSCMHASIHGITTSISYITCGVPQGSILLGPLLFRIYIYMNDISKCSDYGQVARIFADDTNLTFSGCSFPALQNKMSKDLQIKMSKDLKDIASWLSANRLTLKCQKLILWI